jgi:hypothetical protein
MNSALELHDSRVEAVRTLGRELRVVFRAAYVHRTEGRPAVDAGSGYEEPAEMIFTDATYSESRGACVGTVSDGSLCAGSTRFENLIPLPLSFSGRVSATIAFSSGAVLEVTAAGVSYFATGPARFVEAYDG